MSAVQTEATSAAVAITMFATTDISARLTRNPTLGGPPANDSNHAELRSRLHEFCNFLWRLLHPSRASVGHVHFGRSLATGYGDDLVRIDKYGRGSFSCVVCLAEFD